MNSAKREAIFARFKAANPKPQTELEYASSFQLLIAVILSAQATDAGVNKATRELFRVADDAAAMLCNKQIIFRVKIWVSQVLC